MRFDTLLIANRGEIAQRIQRSAQAQGYKTVAIYSEADAHSPHLQLADRALCIGPAPAAQSYLNAQAIIDACQRTGAQAVHPGYGFLSENTDFANDLAKANITFIGPPASAIDAMGNKANAKQIMRDAGVPVVPGYDGDAQDNDTLVKEASRIGYPIMVKATAGGGGRGMRLVHEEKNLVAAIESARNEANSAFGSGELLLERAIINPRHIEIQVFADEHGQAVHLFERDCSIQRRHQKVIEEAPSPAITPEIRHKMGTSAVNAALAIGYVGAGTVEFLLGQDNQFYFLEMNTRLQVEHPVTECITGLDLVALQLQVAQGEALGFGQEDVSMKGHAIEARLYAEDPHHQFLPQTGTLRLWAPPTHIEGVRVDHNLRSNHTISPHYDPMIAKIIAHGSTREDARRRLVRALEACDALGTTTNRHFLVECLRHDEFIRGEATTAFIGNNPALTEQLVIDAKILAAGGAILSAIRTNHKDNVTTSWSSNHANQRLLHLEVHDTVHPVSITTKTGDAQQVMVGTETFEIHVLQSEQHKWLVTIDGIQQPMSAIYDGETLWLKADTLDLEIQDVLRRPITIKEGADGKIKAPMTGKILQVPVTVGQTIEEGQTLAILEAMKMEHNISSPIHGVIAEVFCVEGEQVDVKAPLFVITAKEAQ